MELFYSVNHRPDITIPIRYLFKKKIKNPLPQIIGYADRGYLSDPHNLTYIMLYHKQVIYFMILNKTEHYYYSDVSRECV